jgi:hypothetical protein
VNVPGDTWLLKCVRACVCECQVMDDGSTLSPEQFVMKRMMVEGHVDIWRCGLREIHYGKR